LEKTLDPRGRVVITLPTTSTSSVTLVKFIKQRTGAVQATLPEYKSLSLGVALMSRCRRQVV